MAKIKILEKIIGKIVDIQFSLKLRVPLWLIRLNINIPWMNWKRARSILQLFSLFAIYALVDVHDWKYFTLGGVVIFYAVLNYEDGFESGKRIWKELFDETADRMRKTTREAIELHHELETEMKLRGYKRKN